MKETPNNEKVAELLAESYLIGLLVEEKGDKFDKVERKSLRNSARLLREYADLLIKQEV